LNKHRKGFTLIEVVISMVVIAIIMYAVIAVFITAGVRGVNVEVFTVAQSLAEGKMEETMALPYALIQPAAGDFDVDLSAYHYQVEVEYANADNFDIHAPAPETPYRWIQVTITHPKLEEGITLQSVRANYQ